MRVVNASPLIHLSRLSFTYGPGACDCPMTFDRRSCPRRGNDDRVQMKLLRVHDGPDDRYQRDPTTATTSAFGLKERVKVIGGKDGVVRPSARRKIPQIEEFYATKSCFWEIISGIQIGRVARARRRPP